MGIVVVCGKEIRKDECTTMRELYLFEAIEQMTSAWERKDAEVARLTGLIRWLYERTQRVYLIDCPCGRTPQPFNCWENLAVDVRDNGEKAAIEALINQQGDAHEDENTKEPK